MKDTGVEYAVKIMEKRFIRKEKKVKFVMMERKVFSKVTHDRIVKLFFTFQVGMPVFVGSLARGTCHAAPPCASLYPVTSWLTGVCGV